MSESKPSVRPPLYDISAWPPRCEHRFDVVCVDGQFRLDLWECRYCGQRIRRKKLSVAQPAGV
jgi:transcription elongation factor Elf1